MLILSVCWVKDHALQTVKNWKVCTTYDHLFLTILTVKLWLTDALPDAIQSECSKCSEKQKIGADKVTHYLIDNKPDEWEKLAEKYDKNDEYKKNYLLEKEKSDKEKSSEEE